MGHTHSQGGALHICLAFDLIYTQISFFFPSFVYFFSDFCLIFFVVGASAKFMSQWKTLETFVLSTFQHDFWQIQRVQWDEGEKNSTESSLLPFPKVTHAQLGQVYK